MEESNIKTKHIYSGFYILHYNGYYVVIQKVDNNKWQACLPSGWFANSTSKKACVLNAISEIDITEDAICDKFAKCPDWWETDACFSGIKALANNLNLKKNSYGYKRL